MMEELIVNTLKFNQELMKLNIKYSEEIERLNNIIKEVREYIVKYTDNTNFIEVPANELLEILDKGEKV